MSQTTPSNEKEAKEWMNKLVAMVLPLILRQHSNTFRIGKIRSSNLASRSVTVEITNTGESFNLPYPQGVSDPSPGRDCLIITPDPKVRSKNFVVAIY